MSYFVLKGFIMNAREYLDNAKSVLKLKTDEELCEKIGAKKSTLDKWVQRDSVPLSWKSQIDRIAFIGRLSDHIHEDAIAKNQKYDYIDKLNPVNKEVALELSSSKSTFLSRDKFVHAPIISAKASAGNGSIHYDVETVGQLMIDKMMFKIIPNLKDIRAIEVMGDSMYPTLKENDYVIIEENEQFSGEGIYVLQFDSMLLVKRLQATSRGIKVISDNRNYHEDEYNPNDDQRTFNIVGKVILRIQR